MKKQKLKCKEQERKTIKKNNGITLIALVITIIVLLILAGVTISTLTGENGILTRASDSAEQTEIAEEKEAIGIAYAGVLADNNGTGVSAGELQDELEKNGYKATVTDNGNGTYTVKFESGREYTINADGIIEGGNGESGDNTETDIAGKYYENDTNITVDGKPVTIPGGATISGIDGEYENIDDGLVIYITNGDTIEDWNANEDGNEILDVQEDYDQFVWVPVETAYITEGDIANQTGSTNYEKLQNYIAGNKVYPMAIQLSDGVNYKGILYDFEEGTDGVIATPRDYTTTSSYREPAFLTDSSDGDANTTNNNVGITQNPDSLQAEFNEMVGKVNTNKGFWVGRYETSKMVSDNTQDTSNKIKVIKGTTEGINNVNWYRMYAQQKSYAELGLNAESEITSSMIWGSQWDQIMIWMRNVKNTVNTTNGQYYVTNSVGMGNFGSISGVDDGWSTSSAAPTGYQESYKVKNIYDLAGNVLDWSLEASSTSYRVLRRRRLQHCG